MKKYSKLLQSFYEGDDVIQIARGLLGKVLVTKNREGYTSGMIVETEAYMGINDKAAHVYGDKRTKRTETMYGKAGHAYIYLCYGIHNMLNVVTDKPGVPKAVLIRALEPLDGVDIMLKRRKKKGLDNTLTRGPGSLCGAMGITFHQDGLSLRGNEIWIEDRCFKTPEEKIAVGKRIGVDYAQEDTLLPYRFWVKDNVYVSKTPKKIINLPSE